MIDDGNTIYLYCTMLLGVRKTMNVIMRNTSITPFVDFSDGFDNLHHSSSQLALILYL